MGEGNLSLAPDLHTKAYTAMYTDEHDNTPILHEDWRPDPFAEDNEPDENQDQDQEDGGDQPGGDQPGDSSEGNGEGQGGDAQGEGQGDGGSDNQQDGEGGNQPGQGTGGNQPGGQGGDQQGSGSGEDGGNADSNREGNGDSTGGGSSLSPHNDGNGRGTNPDDVLNQEPQKAPQSAQGGEAGSGQGKGADSPSQANTGAQGASAPPPSMADMANALNADLSKGLPGGREPAGSSGGNNIPSLMSMLNAPSAIDDSNAGHGMDDYSTFSLKGQGSFSIGQLVTRIFSILSEDATGEDKEGADYWNMKDLMTRRIRGADVYSCQRGRQRESIVLLLDTSGSCGPMTNLYSEIATEAAKLGHVEIYACPNGLVESKYNPSTKLYESLPLFLRDSVVGGAHAQERHAKRKKIAERWGNGKSISDDQYAMAEAARREERITGEELAEIRDVYEDTGLGYYNDHSTQNEMCRFVDGTGDQGYESRVYDWHGLHGRTVVYFTDFDAQETMVHNSPHCNLYWFCYDGNLRTKDVLAPGKESPRTRPYWSKEARESRRLELWRKATSAQIWLDQVLRYSKLALYNNVTGGTARGRNALAAKTVSLITGMSLSDAESLCANNPLDKNIMISEDLYKKESSYSKPSGVGTYSYEQLVNMIYNSVVARGFVNPYVTKDKVAATGKIRTLQERVNVAPTIGRAPSGYTGHICAVRSEEDLVSAMKSIRLISR